MDETQVGSVPQSTVLSELSADVLRRLWKQRRDTYAQAHLYESARIRVHRSLTWLSVAQARTTAEHDTKLLELWAAAAALSSRWSELLSSPLPQREATSSFARQIIQWDRDGTLARLLTRLRGEVQPIFGDQYLCRAPGDRDRDHPTGAIPGDDITFLAELLDRIGLAASQLALGSSTYGSSHNRAAVDRSVAALSELVPAFVQVFTEHGYVDDWGALCSPPRS